MDIQSRIKTALLTRGNLAFLAKEADVNHATILKIAHGKTSNPGINTVAAIERALDKLERESAREAATS